MTSSRWILTRCLTSSSRTLSNLKTSATLSTQTRADLLLAKESAIQTGKIAMVKQQTLRISSSTKTQEISTYLKLTIPYLTTIIISQCNPNCQRANLPRKGFMRMLLSMILALAYSAKSARTTKSTLTKLSNRLTRTRTLRQLRKQESPRGKAAALCSSPTILSLSSRQ